MRFLFYGLVGIFLFFTINFQLVKTNLHSEDIQTKLIFLDKFQAGDFLTHDPAEGFFEKINCLDISIQTKENTGSNCVHHYQEFLKEDVDNFSKKEKKIISKSLKKVLAQIQNLNPSLLPKEIKLIKTKGEHYGPTAYYTRKDGIIMPQAQLDAFDRGSFEAVMLHEIFHILSRQNSSFKDKMYSIIGYEKFAKPLIIPAKLKELLVLNPDGVSRDFYIGLKPKGEIEERAFIPLTFSTKGAFDIEQPTFFSYLGFSLFELKENEENFEVLVRDDATATIPMSELSEAFFVKIGNNTNYIIHPDEVLADNFIFAVQKANEVDIPAFSPEGEELLNKIIAALKE